MPEVRVYQGAGNRALWAARGGLWHLCAMRGSSGRVNSTGCTGRRSHRSTSSTSKLRCLLPVPPRARPEPPRPAPLPSGPCRSPTRTRTLDPPPPDPPPPDLAPPDPAPLGPYPGSGGSSTRKFSARTRTLSPVSSQRTPHRPGDSMNALSTTTEEPLRSGR